MTAERRAEENVQKDHISESEKKGTLERKLVVWHHMVHESSLIRCFLHLTLHSLSSSDVFLLLCVHVHSQYLISSSPLPLLSLTVWS